MKKTNYRSRLLASLLALLMLSSSTLLLSACQLKKNDLPEPQDTPDKQDTQEVQDEQDVWNFEFRLNDDGAGYTLIGASMLEEHPHVVIPDTHKGLPVTAIEASTFARSPIQSLTVPGSIASIPDEAFTACEKLTKITLGEGITSIGSFAFSMNKVTELTLPNSLMTLGEGAFYNCQSLERITFGDGLASIGNDAFSMNSSMKSISIPSLESYLKIDFQSQSAAPFVATEAGGAISINGISGASVLAIPETVTSIPAYAFYKCSSLFEVQIPASVTYIGENAFTESSVTSVSIPDSVTTLEQNAFWLCNDLTDVTIGNGLSTIKPFTFAGCTALKNLTFGSSVTVIENNAFYLCDSLQNVTYYGTQAEWNQIDASGTFPFPYAQITHTEEPVWSEWETITEATCKTEGLRKRTNDKGGVEEEIIPLLDHVAVTDPAVAPQCEETGLTEGSHCELCGDTLVAQQTVAAAGHSYENGSCLNCGEPQPADVWDGTVDTSWYNENQSTFTITTAEQLAGLAQLSNVNGKDFQNKTVYLNADIDLAEREWSPIGARSTFVGIFDGQNHTISNLKITNPTYGLAGLFGSQQGELKNIILTDVNITSNAVTNVGALVGMTKCLNWSTIPNGDIINCHASGTITVTSESTSNPWIKIGGLVGSHGDYSKLENCSADVEIVFETEEANDDFLIYVGGLAGSINNQISNCFATGNVTANALSNELYAGGLAAVATGENTAQNCYATGNVTAYTRSDRVRAGGLFGTVSSNYDPFVLKNCYATGNVNATTTGTSTSCNVYAGGLVGSAKNVSFIRSYATGNVSGTVGTSYANHNYCYVGSLMGGILSTTGTDNTSFESCYYSAAQQRSATGSNPTRRTDGVAKDLTAIQTQSFYTDTLGWSSDIWSFENGQHPTLK